MTRLIVNSRCTYETTYALSSLSEATFSIQTLCLAPGRETRSTIHIRRVERTMILRVDSDFLFQGTGSIKLFFLLRPIGEQ